MQKQPVRIVAAAADPNTRMTLAKAYTDAGWEIRTTGDGKEALALLHSFPSDVLLLQLPLKSYDGLEVLRRIPREGLYLVPGVILSAHSGMDPFAAHAKELGAACVLENRAPLQEFLQASANITAEDRLYAARGCAEGIRRLLDRLSFPEGHPGEKYLATALRYVLTDGRLLHDMAHGLYPLVAKAHGVQPAQVERGIRHAIEKAWSVGRTEEQYALFENTIDEKRGKPTNAGMIAMAAEFLRKEEGTV
ncbi:MAG: sporulation initiation factor Spo0A C-terminal domain-containing protein [Eubacteriales bacterium]|nr:sporulation initiation factor Spo0A C-terminal domain-containing protein [Eubacteriales bacterium]